MYSTDYCSPLGKILILSDGEAICGIYFHNKKHFDDLIRKEDLTIFSDVEKWLDDYFDGKNPKINFKLKLDGSDFQRKVWKILSEIPYGKTMTYGEIADMISPTMSAQAVGGAVGRNPISIIIPCHRVLGKDGKLTGYAAGIDKKVELLKLEGINDFKHDY